MAWIGSKRVHARREGGMVTALIVSVADSGAGRTGRRQGAVEDPGVHERWRRPRAEHRAGELGRWHELQKARVGARDIDDRFLEHARVVLPRRVLEGVRVEHDLLVPGAR